MSDSFSQAQIQQVIWDNQEISIEKQEYSDVDEELLMYIFDVVNTCESISEFRRRIIRRASYILSLITNKQPFHDCNRSTAISTAIGFLRLNGLKLQVEDELIILVNNTKKKNENDVTLVSEVEDYLITRVKED